MLGEAGELLAHSRGYFAQQQLAIEFVKVDPSTVVAALTSGQIDVAGLGVEAGLFNAIHRGVDLRIVAALAASEPQANGAFLVVRKDLIDSGKIRTYADLKGLNIGIPAPASSIEYIVARTMEAGGLALSDAHLVVPTFPGHGYCTRHPGYRSRTAARAAGNCGGPERIRRQVERYR